MSDRSAVEAVRNAPALTDPHNVAKLLRLTVAKDVRPSSRVVRVLCPWHSERVPSCGLELRGGILVAHCQSCKQGGDVLSLIAAVEDMHIRHDFPAILARAAELGGVNLAEHHVEPAPPRRRKLDDPLEEAQWQLAEARREANGLRREVDHLKRLLQENETERIMEKGLWRALYNGACDVIAELQSRLEGKVDG